MREGFREGGALPEDGLTKSGRAHKQKDHGICMVSFQTTTEMHMARASTLWGMLFNVKQASFTEPDILETEDVEPFLCLHATVHKRYRCLCPHCGRSCLAMRRTGT